MDEFKTNKIELVDIKISKNKEQGKWIVRVHGVTSGFTVHTSDDDSTIEFAFDASRFEPFIIKV